MKNIYFALQITILLLVLFITSNYSQSFNEYISDANTVLLLHLNETTGTIAYDASSYNNHGTINGNEPSEGRYFGGRRFPTNNTDQGIILQNLPSLNISGPLTLEAWIKADSYEQAGTFIIRHDEYQLCLGSFGSAGYLQFFRHVNDQWVIYYSDVQIPLNEWVHVAGVWDGSNASLFINGNLVNSTTAAYNYLPIYIPRVASHDSTAISPASITLIDEIRISNVARSFIPSPTFVDNQEASIIQAYELSQNYPNPFNPTTTISYSLPFSANVTLKVYDVLGNQVTTLIDEYQSTGQFAIKFYAESLSSGIYFYVLEVGGFAVTKKMILLK